MTPPITPAVGRKLEALFASWNRSDSPGVALSIVEKGEVVYQHGFGSANLEYGIPISLDTVFHTASLAKQVTALAVLLLADRQALSLDDPIGKHLPDLGHPITLRHLLQHTSGLRDQWELLILAGWRMDDVITREQILRLVRRQTELNFAPGTAFMYCNTGYTLLAEVVARVSGQPFRQFARTHIFAPLGMDRTRFCDDHTEIVPDRAYSYSPLPDGNGFRKSVLNYATAGATSLLASAADLARWIANFERPIVGHTGLFRQMEEPAVLADGSPVGYGLGVGLGLHRGFRVVQHIGIDAGYRAFLCRFPELHLGIALLGNLSTLDVRSLIMQAAETVLDGRVEWSDGLPAPGISESAEPQPETERVSDDLLQLYAGSYYSTELDTVYHIAPVRSGLAIQHQRRDELQAAATATDTFVAQTPYGPLTLRFVRSESQQVTGFRLDGTRVRNLWFSRAR